MRGSSFNVSSSEDFLNRIRLFGGSSVGPDVTDSVFRGDIEMT